MSKEKSKSAGLSARIRPGESIKLREGVEIVNSGESVCRLQIKQINEQLPAVQEDLKNEIKTPA